jgi:hypothetical protein
MRLNGPLRPDPRIRNPRLPPRFHPTVKMFEFFIPMARTQVPAGAHELAVDDEHQRALGYAASPALAASRRQQLA